MRDSTNPSPTDQLPAPPRTLEQIPLQEHYRQVPEDVLPPVTPPQVPAEQPIEADEEDTQPPDQPHQSMQPPLTLPIRGLNVPLPDSPTQDSIPGSPGPPHDPPPPSPPPAGTPVHAQGSPEIHWFAAPGTPPWSPQVSMTHGQPPPPTPPPAHANHCASPLPMAGRTFHSKGIQPSEGMMPLTTGTGSVAEDARGRRAGSKGCGG